MTPEEKTKFETGIEAAKIQEAAKKKEVLIEKLAEMPSAKLAVLYADLLEKSKDQQKDIKVLANIMYKICLMLGFVNDKKEVTKDLNTSKIIKNAGALVGGLMMPGASKKFQFVFDLVPLLEKYKNSID